MIHAGDHYRDREGRLFRLEQRVDPRGPIPAFWHVVTVDEVDLSDGRQSVIREDRLGSDYKPAEAPNYPQAGQESSDDVSGPQTGAEGVS